MPVVLLFIIFVILLVIAIPVSITLGITAVLPSIFDPSFTVGAKYLIRAMFGGLDSFPLLAVPMFVLSGIIMAKGGISRKLFDVFAYFLGNFTAGMPCAVVVTCLFYGAISGSAPATVAAVGSMTIPVLTSLGYDLTFSTAIVTVAGGLGVIIPPSIPFIMYGMASGASVSDLFLAGVIPGLMIGLLLMLYAIYHCKRYGEDKEKIGANYQKLHSRGFLGIMKSGFWALLCPVIILGGIYSGIFSPTEAACVSVIYAVLVSMAIYRTINLRKLWELILESVKSIAPLCVLLALATAFSRVLTMLNAPQALAEFISGAISGKIAFLILLNVALLILGMFIDGAPAILILSPLLMPIAAEFGIDPVHLGIVIVCNLTIGLASPPFGLNLFVASSTSGAPVMEIGKKIIPFIAMFLIALVLITFIPQISLCLI